MPTHSSYSTSKMLYGIKVDILYADCVVCGKRVTTTVAVNATTQSVDVRPSLVFCGVTYYFCSPQHLTLFELSPKAYLCENTDN